MGSLRAICRPHTVFSSFFCCKHRSFLGISMHNRGFRLSAPSGVSRYLDLPLLARTQLAFRTISRRTVVAGASNWTSERSPYDTLELERDADEEKIKSAYRRLAKYYHPDVYDGRGTLEEGETAEARFIKIQAAYELLIDEEKRSQYDRDHRMNPMKASEAWMEWLIKKRKAFDQRGDMAIATWAEQQQREMNLLARRLSRSVHYYPCLSILLLPATNWASGRSFLHILLKM